MLSWRVFGSPYLIGGDMLMTTSQKLDVIPPTDGIQDKSEKRAQRRTEHDVITTNQMRPARRETSGCDNNATAG